MTHDDRPQPILDSAMQRDREMLREWNADFNASYRDQYANEPDADLHGTTPSVKTIGAMRDAMPNIPSPLDPPLVRTGNGSFTRDQFAGEPDADLPLVRTGNGAYARDYDGGKPWQRPLDFACGVIAGACVVGCFWIAVAGGVL